MIDTSTGRLHIAGVGSHKLGHGSREAEDVPTVLVGPQRAQREGVRQ
jgi:hypothetical protein